MTLSLTKGLIKADIIAARQAIEYFEQKQIKDIKNVAAYHLQQAVVNRSENDFLSLIQVDTISYRAATDTRAVRKNVSLPQWMANLAEKRGVNCSQILQESLMKKLRA